MMELLGGVGHVEARFGLFRYSANLNARWVPSLRRTNQRKSFWTHCMELLGDVGHSEPCFDPVEDSVSVGAS
jgi:hypothetical protein